MKANSGKGNTPEHDSWRTNETLWNALNKQYSFSFDCCANRENTKTEKFSDDFLSVNSVDGIAWMNPPFSKAKEMFEHFFKVVDRGVAIYRFDNAESKTWHKTIFPKATWVFIPKSRVEYADYKNNPTRGKARFPSVIIGYNVPELKDMDGILIKDFQFLKKPKPKGKTIVSLSGGKDSTAMLLRLLEMGEQVDEILFADTGFEFPELYDYLKRVEDYTGQKITFVKPETSFDDWRFGAWGRGPREGLPRGFPKVLAPCYWAREAKIKPLTKAHKKYDTIYVGIAYDEKQRCVKEAGNIRYPLVEWKWTEQDCVDYLNEKGMLNPLYVNFKRLGCWLCPKQGKNSLYVLWKNYPELWSKLEVYEQENISTTGSSIFMEPLSDIKNQFIESGEPQNTFKGYECTEGCDSVKRAFLETKTGLKSINCGVKYQQTDTEEEQLLR